MYVYLCYFLIYSFLGWCIEVCYAALNTKKFINRGFLNGPYCPIYGAGAVAVMYFICPFKKNLLVLFAVSVILTSAIELFTGFGLEKAFHYRWWDYSEVPFNLGGYICLKFSIIWGFACVFVIEIIHPVVKDIVSWVPIIAGEIFVSILFLLMAADLIVTVKTVLKLNTRMEKLQVLADDIHKFSDEAGEIFVSILFLLMAADLIVTVKTVLKLNTRMEKLQVLADDIHKFSDEIGSRVSSDFLNIQHKLEELREKREKVVSEKISWIEKRIMSSFPDMKSTKYSENILKDIRTRNFNKNNKS